MNTATAKLEPVSQEYDVHYCMEVGDDFIFRCHADDRTHALEKFMEAEPEATVIGVWLTEDMNYAGVNCNA